MSSGIVKSISEYSKKDILWAAQMNGIPRTWFRGFSLKDSLGILPRPVLISIYNDLSWMKAKKEN